MTRIDVRTPETAEYCQVPVGSWVDTEAFPALRPLTSTAPTDALRRYVETHARETEAWRKSLALDESRAQRAREALEASEQELKWARAALAERELEEKAP